jgi:hypothetical protein
MSLENWRGFSYKCASGGLITMSAKLIPVVFTVIITSATVLPVSAQGFDIEKTARIKAAQAAMPDIGRAYGMRITVGNHSSAGFEKSLTEGDPNLKHWTWLPISSAEQAYIHKAPGSLASGNAAPHKSRGYMKCNTAPLPMVTYYSKPVEKHASTDVSAKLTASKAPTPVATETRVYRYSDVSGRLNAPPMTAMSEAKDVYGNLVSPSHTH